MKNYYAVIVRGISNGDEYVHEDTLLCGDVYTAKKTFNDAIEDCIGQNYYGHPDPQILRMENWNEGSALWCAYYKHNYIDEHVEISVQEVQIHRAVETLDKLFK